MAIITGLKDLYWAKMTKDDDVAQYDVPGKITGVRSVDVTPLTESSDVESDDNVETYYANNGGNVTIEFKNLASGDYTKLAGLRKMSNGIVVSGGLVNPPDVAIGYKRTMRDKGGNTWDRYVWLLKVKLTEQQETATTKGSGAPTPQYPTLGGRAENRKCDDEWKIFIDSNDPAYTAAIGQNWFTKATLEVLYNVASAVNGAPAEVEWFTGELPATGRAGVVYIATDSPDSYYWDGAEFQLLSSAE